MKFITFGLLLLVTPSLAAAEGGPAFDCAAAQSDAEKLICKDADLAALDRRLSDRFADASRVAAGLSVGADAATKDLRATQRGWISGRDDCWKEPDLGACVRREYLSREAELVAFYLLEPAASVTNFSCGAVGTLTVSLFETELPGIRIELGDTVTAGAAMDEATPEDFWLAGFGGFTLTENGADFSDPAGTVTACSPES